MEIQTVFTIVASVVGPVALLATGAFFGNMFVTRKELDKDLDREFEGFKRELYTRLDEMEARLIPEDRVVLTVGKPKKEEIRSNEK